MYCTLFVFLFFSPFLFLQVLKTTHSLKVVHSIEECLRHISLGLLANSALPITSLLVMVHGVCSQNNSGLGMIAGRNV